MKATLGNGLGLVETSKSNVVYAQIVVRPSVYSLPAQVIVLVKNKNIVPNIYGLPIIISRIKKKWWKSVSWEVIKIDY